MDMTFESKQTNPSAIAPRVFALVPSKSDSAVLIVRSNNKLTALFSWDTRTDDVELSQWLKGRIYEYVSDISADGEHLLYSANKKGEGYTVLSRAPWLKAIGLWHNVGGFGGGVFCGNAGYSLFDGSDHYQKLKPKDFVLVEHAFLRKSSGVYIERLQRTGWIMQPSQDTSVVAHKPINQYLTLEKIWQENRSTGNNTGKGAYSEHHGIHSFTKQLALPTWEWADIINNRLIWVEKGCLYSVPIPDGDVALDLQAPNLIYAFRELLFEKREAPY